MPAVIYSDTFVWDGATVAVTVDDNAPGYAGQYFWDYHVTNDSFGDGIDSFGVYVDDPGSVSNFGSSAGWAGGIGLSGDPNFASWLAHGLPSIGVGNSADFWFTTPPTGLALTSGFLADPGAASTRGGFLAVPLAAAGFAIQNAPLVVTTKNDVVDEFDKWLSLREAINFTNSLLNTAPQRQILFAAPLANQTITLNPNAAQGYGQLTLEKSVFIDGANQNITIQRDPGTAIKHRIFEVLGTSDAKLKGLTLQNGKLDGPGGAVYSKGNLTVENCYFIQNEATDSSGGAIAATEKSLTISGSYFTGNTAKLGGAVFIGERVTTTITGGAFTLNTATNSGEINNGSGGAIYIYSSTTATATSVTLVGVELYENRAFEAGGAICVNTFGGAGTSLSLLGGTYIHDNQVTAGFGKGGGVYFGKGTLTLGGAIIAGNTAATGNQIYRLNTGTTLFIMPGTLNIYEDVTGP